jgi:Mg-chelatase subunit ChlD
MKARNHLLLGSLLALSLLLPGCQNSLPLANNPNPGGTNSGITPPPKGPKPVPITPDVGLVLAPAAPTTVTNGNKGQQEAYNAGAGATTDISATAPRDAALEMPEQPPVPSPTSTAQPTSEPTVNPETRNFFYFSYDDSASTAGVELTKYALRNQSAPQSNWARPWEFLNYESFAKQGQQSTGKFQVSMGLWQYGDREGQGAATYELGVHVSAPEIEKQARRNLVLTLVLDVSGSMDEQSVVVSQDGRAPSLLDLAKTGMQEVLQSLKPGDVVNVVSFSDNAKTLLEGFAISENNSAYTQVVSALKTESSTNLNAGLTEAYAVARKTFDATKINRVVMLTDAFANAGEVNAELVSQATRINNAEGIYFSGLGFGSNFNEAFLDRLTEAGRGAYFSVVTTTDAKRAFNERFMALTNVAARNVQFRLDYPAGLKRALSASEESSQVQSEVQPVNFSYNTSQFFWEQFTKAQAATLGAEPFKLTIHYTDPETGVAQTEVYEKPAAEILGAQLNNIKDAHMVTLLTSLMRGDKSPAQARTELDGILSDYSSPIATEYRSLIETFLKLRGTSVAPQPVNDSDR